jgi:hypothetical protein
MKTTDTIDLYETNSGLLIIRRGDEAFELFEATEMNRDEFVTHAHEWLTGNFYFDPATDWAATPCDTETTENEPTTIHIASYSIADGAQVSCPPDQIGFSGQYFLGLR